AVADVGLHVNAAELRPDDRAGGTRLETAGVLAVLADIRRELPRRMLRRIAATTGARLMLDKLHMTPRRSAEREHVVVRKPGPEEAVVRNVVPFFARDFAGFAADA